MSDLHAMPITNIAHNACRYTVELGVSAKRSYTYHTWQQSYSLYASLSTGDRLCVYQKLLVGYDATIVINACNHRECWKSKWCNHRRGYFCHYYIAWKSNNAGEARGQSWNESLKSRYIPGGLCRLFERYKAKTFCCAFVAAAMLTMVVAATIVRFPPVFAIDIHVCKHTVLCSCVFLSIV